MENSIFGINGAFILGYRALLPEKYSLGQEDYDLLNEYWAKAIRDLPSNSVFFKQDIFKEKKFDASDLPETNFLQKYSKQYFEGREMLEHTTNIFFILPNKVIQNDRLKNPFRPPNKKLFKEFDNKIKDFIVSVSQSISYLNNIKLTGGNSLDVKPLTSEYLNSYYSYINSGLSENYDVELKNEWNYLRVGSEYCSIIRFPKEDKFPEKMLTCRKDTDFSNDKSVFFKNYGDNFSFDLNFSHIYNQIAFVDDAKLHINNARKNNVELKKTQNIDRSNKFWADQTDEMLNEITLNSDSERIVRAHNNIVVFANTESELENRINRTVDKFKDIDIRGQRVFGNNLLALYEYSYPVNVDLFVNEHLYIANLEMFSSFLISSGKYNDDEAGVLYNSRLGNIPVKVDVWDEEKKYIRARNFMIFAPTGYGKSFNANHIIADDYANGTKIVIVDLGGSYRKLSALFPDTAYITYNEGDNLGINPFRLQAGENITSEKIEELAEFVGVHYRRDSEMTQQERVSLKKIIELYYKNIKQDHSLPSFVNSFTAEKEEVLEALKIKKEYFDADEFILLMSEFVEGGLYSFLYENENEDFSQNLVDKSIIVFELDRIRENKLLLSIMLQLISSTIDKVIWKDKNTRGKIIFDEVAEQLQWDGMLRRIQWFYQAIRKQNGSIGIILQSVSQLPTSDLSKSIIENTQILFVLYAKDYRALQHRFDLSEHAYYQLTSISSNFKSEKPYSEIFIMRGDKHQVYRLEVPKEVYWAYQTEGAENHKLMQRYEETNNMEEAILQKISEDNIL